MTAPEHIPPMQGEDIFVAPDMADAAQVFLGHPIRMLVAGLLATRPGEFLSAAEIARELSSRQGEEPPLSSSLSLSRVMLNSSLELARVGYLHQAERPANDKMLPEFALAPEADPWFMPLVGAGMSWHLQHPPVALHHLLGMVKGMVPEFNRPPYGAQPRHRLAAALVASSPGDPLPLSRVVARGMPQEVARRLTVHMLQNGVLQAIKYNRALKGSITAVAGVMLHLDPAARQPLADWLDHCRVLAGDPEARDAARANVLPIMDAQDSLRTVAAAVRRYLDYDKKDLLPVKSESEQETDVLYVHILQHVPDDRPMPLTELLASVQAAGMDVNWQELLACVGNMKGLSLTGAAGQAAVRFTFARSQLGQRWREAARCASSDIKTDSGYRLSADDFAFKDPHTSEHVEAVCRQCPASGDCLADALSTEEYEGIRGGLWPRAQRQLPPALRDRIVNGSSYREDSDDDTLPTNT